MRLVGDENLKLVDLSPTKTIFLPPQKLLSGETLYAETCIPQLNAFFTTWVRGRSYVPNYSNKARESGSMRALMKGLSKSASDILQSAPEKCKESVFETQIL